MYSFQAPLCWWSQCTIQERLIYMSYITESVISPIQQLALRRWREASRSAFSRVSWRHAWILGRTSVFAISFKAKERKYQTDVIIKKRTDHKINSFQECNPRAISIGDINRIRYCLQSSVGELIRELCPSAIMLRILGDTDNKQFVLQ